MGSETDALLALVEAVGIGLLIGIERERNAPVADGIAAAGVRTFAVASLAGALAMFAGGAPVLIAVLVVVGAVRIASQMASEQPSGGLTTTLALLSAVLLGALSTMTMLVAASAAVAVASLLAAREALHGFSRTVLSAHELRDGLILGVAVLVILPVLPNVEIGPNGTLNPRTLFLIVVLVMAIGATGHIATRLLGPRLGLPLGGFLSGFVSSTSTVAALGQRAAEHPTQEAGATAGAILSSVSSVAVLGVVLGASSSAMLAAGSPVLLGAGVVAAAHGAFAFVRAMRAGSKADALDVAGPVFSVLGALRFAAVVAAVMVVAATANAVFGSAAAGLSIALAGLVSTTSAAVALGAMISAGQVSPAEGAIALAAALSANIVVRIVFALRVGPAGYRTAVALNLALQLAGLWALWWLTADTADWLPRIALLD